MTRLHSLCFAGLLVLGLPACAAATATFSPFNSVDAQPSQIAAIAIVIRPGDRAYLKKVEPKVLGWVTSKGEPGDETIVQSAREEAARRGGTHILLRGSQKDIDIESVPFGPAGAISVDETQSASYVVLRVSEESWESLPPPLRPSPFVPPAIK